MQVDPAFRGHRRRALIRRRWRWARSGAAGLAILGMIGVVGWRMTVGDIEPDVVTGAATTSQRGPAGPGNGSDNEPDLVQVEDAFDIAPVVRADTFTDIPGDPLILTLPGAGDRPPKIFVGPTTLDVGRVGLPAPDRLILVTEPLVVRERRLMTTLPSSREDFALFQSQRGRSLADAIDPPPAPIDPLIDADLAIASKAPTSTTIFIRPEAERQALSQETVVDLKLTTSLADLLTGTGFEAGAAKTLSARVEEKLDLGGPLPAGSVLAVRYAPQSSGPRLLQMSLYGLDGWKGSVAQTGRGDLIAASDPWLDQDIMALARDDEGSGDAPIAGAQFRLLDAIYSAAIRAEVPTEIVGEMIAMMAQVHDIDGLAADGDKLRLLYAKDHGAGGQLAGQLLFVGVDGPSGQRFCYVVPRSDSAGYRCHAPGARIAATEGAAVSMAMPVNGALRRKFGPQGRNADALPGVEFSAAENSVVTAAAPGRVVAIGDDPVLGRNVLLDHGSGMATRYGWLSAAAEGIQPGDLVAAGAPVGRVGVQPGGQGEPALIFQALRNGGPVDPLPLLSGGVTVLASNAVETLIGRIIRVESGGNAQAKNPLSSATGLGQFIDSTWLRMMRSYRPDLATTMPVPDLLSMRFDPALSREMVKHLAQENEAYLRARGHAITAGRLYLAHFLGPEGASKVLSSDNALPILAVMGAGVVRANPFLASYTVGDLKGWADRKMTGGGVAAATSEPEREPPPSPAVTAYVRAMDALLKDAGTL